MIDREIGREGEMYVCGTHDDAFDDEGFGSVMIECGATTY